MASFQKECYGNLPKLLSKRTAGPAANQFHSEVDFLPMADSFGDFLSLVRTSAPSPLATEATKLLSQGKSVWVETLQDFWKAGLFEAPKENEGLSEPFVNPIHEFLARAYLQPYAEFIVSSMLPPNLPMTVCRCPRCNSLPLLGVLRPEGDGGKRFLQCALCSQESGVCLPAHPLRLLRRRARRSFTRFCFGAITSYTRGILPDVQTIFTHDRPDERWQCCAAGGRPVGRTSRTLG